MWSNKIVCSESRSGECNFVLRIDRETPYEWDCWSSFFACWLWHQSFVLIDDDDDDDDDDGSDDNDDEDDDNDENDDDYDEDYGDRFYI